MFPHGPVPWTDTLRVTPSSKAGAIELFLLVTDQIPGMFAHSSNHTAEERPETLGSGFAGEYGKALDL